jgi:exopolyphosphatase/guanosine-5'-triphosphate,3'-diphosphate pyrophosphatase
MIESPVSHTLESSVLPSERRVVAAIDCGSTSIRCSIAELSQRGWTAVDDADYPLDLLDAIRRRRLNRMEMERLLQGFRDITDLCKSYGVSAIRAVATPSLREVNNVDAVLERVKLSYGLDVDLLDGAEEGRLYHQALSWVLAQESHQMAGDVLLMDLGSATSSVCWIRDGNLVQALEEHIGTERFAFNFGDHRDDAVMVNSLDRLALGASRVLMNRLVHPGHVGAMFETVMITGRGPRELVKLMGGKGNSLLPKLSLNRINETFLMLMRLAPLDRKRWAMSSDVDVDGLLSSLAIMRRIGTAAQVEHLVVPELRLRVGLLFDFLPGAPGPYRLPREHLVTAATELAVRYGMDRAYALNTAALAVQIFDATSRLHRLGERARLLLEVASIVHDVGAHISVRSRHKHSFYILRNVDLSGLTMAEREIVAQVARYHRSGVPISSHQEYMQLDRTARMEVSTLAAILRVAYALDVERSQRIKRVKCTIQKNVFLIETNVQDVALERWSMERKSGLFKTVFGLDVQLVPEQSRSSARS